VFNNCLLGSSTIHTLRRQSFGPGQSPGPVTADGSCSIEASCVERQGQTVPGDGSVGLKCEAGACVCELEPHTPPKDVVTFGFAATCWTQERAEQLVREHCLKGMHMAPHVERTYAELAESGATDLSKLYNDALLYSIVSGREIAPSLHESETHLNIDLNGLVTLEQHQPPDEGGGDAIGTFQEVLPPELATRLREALAAIDLERVAEARRDTPAAAPPTAGGPSTITIERIVDLHTVRAAFQSDDLSAVRRLRPLLAALDAVFEFARQRPMHAIQLALEPASPPGVFTVKVRNAGSWSVQIPDLLALARPAADDPYNWFGVRVAESTPAPGVAVPLRWARVALEPASGMVPRRLEPEQEVTFRTQPIPGAKPGVRQRVQAMLVSYAGEVEVDGERVIRGRALSAPVEWTP
jgi:hypothetical protein